MKDKKKYVRRSHSKRLCVSIPEDLEKKARDLNLSFSAILQDALREILGES